MKIYNHICFMMFCMLFATATGAETTESDAKTCAVPTYTLSYDCGAGTEKKTKTLPSTETVTYGQEVEFRHTDNLSVIDSTGLLALLTDDFCTPPAGKTQAGHELWVGDTLVGGEPMLMKPFRYYFKSDMVIRPHYVDSTESDVRLWNLRNEDWSSIPNNSGVFVVPYYGKVIVEAACSTIKPLNKEAGYIPDNPDNQGSIEAGNFKTGKFCYCRIKTPTFDKSPWVFLREEVDNTFYCQHACGVSCPLALKGSYVVRAALLSGARPDVE